MRSEAESSCVSMKSDQSMDPPIKLKSGDSQPDFRSVHQKRSEAESSCVSMKSDQSMDPPIKLKSGDSQPDFRSVHQKRSEAESSCVSMKSDQSMDPPIKLKSGDSQPDFRVHLVTEGSRVMYTTTEFPAVAAYAAEPLKAATPCTVVAPSITPPAYEPCPDSAAEAICKPFAHPVLAKEALSVYESAPETSSVHGPFQCLLRRRCMLQNLQRWQQPHIHELCVLPASSSACPATVPFSACSAKAPLDLEWSATNGLSTKTGQAAIISLACCQIIFDNAWF
ncbi:hypothetical protein QQF64_036342 [Cirrhinus molitorella]|uniref:Uncharacterized protein n=1 Tax=Cirrhinus molitorella TaxID=172907 RepID=A0ABR3NIC3_9TELE